MKYLFFLGHPAHFHLFRNTIDALISKGHKVFILIKKKDILEDLLKHSGHEYVNVLPDGRADGKIGIAIGVIKKDWELLRFCLKNKPDLMMGTSAEIAHVGKFLGIPSMNFNEDDAGIIKTFAKLTYPFSTHVVSPIGCDNEQWNKKTIAYNGYHKLAYLHPNRFAPDLNVVHKYFSTEKPYYLLRFAKLNAHHDAGIQGISTDIAQKVIDLLTKTGNVYITSERELEPQFEKYRLKINPLDIHHIMYYADIYLGDSQSMAVEAAMLGTPSIRFSDFSGRISVLEELEHKYGLTFGIKPTTPTVLFDKLKELVNTPDLKKIFLEKRDKMLAEKIDVSAFFTWLIEKYPNSSKIIKNDPQYYKNFLMSSV